MLFHYHFWTPLLEETERYYASQGFKTHLRIGKYKGDFVTFNPPLTWDDIRDKEILFRIIEMRKGIVNITFGFGKEIIFDHIGFLVEQSEHDQICEKAIKMEWKVNIDERRTFITTPYQFRIELQTHLDVIDYNQDEILIQQMVLNTRQTGLEEDLAFLFGKDQKLEIQVLTENQPVTIREVVITDPCIQNSQDPNGVKVMRTLRGKLAT
ncbi:hypothetical protein IC620_05370 [Hazenella sp. IB182357]|uniref:Uncharacterized protein n=1 Tax=Polycladospora coralii TaxID=2771432 RepID=A0A926RTJ8_9BACL|nr:hypothetical protein [Polycladospora coralii]MBD1371788.1 hypothetical protein [Polycladospora coralii]MBS7529249.1 hypothetical protein [Polycladospora coralii]